MNRKVVILLVLFVFISFDLFSQYQICLNEKGEKIDCEIYAKKVQLPVYQYTKTTKDTINIYSIGLKFWFGKITKEEFSQIHQYFAKRSNKTIDADAILFIKYTDTIISTGDMNLLDYADNFLGHNGKHKDTFTSDKKMHRRREFINSIEKGRKLSEKNHKRNTKCKRTLSAKYNLAYINAMSHYKGKTENRLNLNHILDSEIIRNTFLNNESNGFVFLRPDGSYFFSRKVLTKKQLVKLSTKNWEHIKNDLQRTIATSSKNGLGFFKKAILTRNDIYCSP